MDGEKLRAQAIEVALRDVPFDARRTILEAALRDAFDRGVDAQDAQCVKCDCGRFDV